MKAVGTRLLVVLRRRDGAKGLQGHKGRAANEG
jgi:hypothetical protein